MGTCASVQSAMVQPTLDFHDISMEEKRKAILDKITSEPKVADLKLTFYMAACESMSDSGRTLVPSPKEYLRKRPLKEALQEVNESIPNLRLLRLYLARPDAFHISDDAISLLYWLLIRLKEPGLIPLENQENWPDFTISDDISAGDSLRKPDMILKVRYSTMSTRHMQWKSHSFGKKTMDAYTGVRLEDVHSTLHCGPKRLVEMGGLGYGLSLCSKLSGCLSRTKPSWTWGKSCLATKMSVVMMIQFADNSQKVLRLAHQPVFYLISDPSYARIRYLFIWINSPPPRLPDLQMPLDNKTNMQFLLSSLVLVSSLFLPKEAPGFLQNSLCTLTALGERLLKHH